MNWTDFVTNVKEWSIERGIYKHSTALMQTYKAIGEFGELVDAVAKNDKDGIADGIGDVCVCLVNVAKLLGKEPRTPCKTTIYDDDAGLIADTLLWLYGTVDNIRFIEPDDCLIAINRVADNLKAIASNHGLTLNDCLFAAWNEIKDRKGRMVEGGVFIKES